MNKIIGISLSIMVLIVGSFIIHRTATNAMRKSVKSLETNCINNSFARIKKIPQCEQYSIDIKTMDNPNCMNGETMSIIIKTMQEAKDNNCTFN